MKWKNLRQRGVLQAHIFRTHPNNSHMVLNTPHWVGWHVGLPFLPSEIWQLRGGWIFLDASARVLFTGGFNAKPYRSITTTHKPTDRLHDTSWTLERLAFGETWNLFKINPWKSTRLNSFRVSVNTCSWEAVFAQRTASSRKTALWNITTEHLKFSRPPPVHWAAGASSVRLRLISANCV